MPILRLFESKINEFKNKTLEKKAYLPQDAVACGIATLVKQDSRFEIVKECDAICIRNDGIALDLLSDILYEYSIFEGFSEIKNAYESGKLTVGEKFCYSVYDANQLFPDIKFKQTKDEVKDYLRAYNTVNHTLLYWSFLDKDEIEELNKKADANAKRYSKFYY